MVIAIVVLVIILPLSWLGITELMNMLRLITEELNVSKKQLPITTQIIFTITSPAVGLSYLYAKISRNTFSYRASMCAKALLMAADHGYISLADADAILLRIMKKLEP